MALRIGKYLTVQEEVMPSSRQTKVWRVIGSDGSSLGQIRWYAQWRQFTFWPNGMAVLNATCLDDIAKFTKAETAAYLAGRAAVRPALMR